MFLEIDLNDIDLTNDYRYTVIIERSDILKKKFLMLLIIFVCLFTMTACNQKDNNTNKSKVEEDSIKFKEDYEKLNGKTRDKDGKTIRTIEISKDNPFKYKTEDELIQAINNKETFIVYFGFNDCPWCRSVVPTLIEVAKDLKIDNIYYVDVKEIRDVLELDDDNKAITKTKGSDGYYKLLKLLDNVLADYELTTKDGEKIKTGEKRIFAPNIVAVVDGKPKKLTSGISSKQNDAYMELSDDMKEDMYNNIKAILELIVDTNNSCSYNSAC